MFESIVWQYRFEIQFNVKLLLALTDCFACGQEVLWVQMTRTQTRTFSAWQPVEPAPTIKDFIVLCVDGTEKLLYVYVCYHLWHLQLKSMDSAPSIKMHENTLRVWMQ